MIIVAAFAERKDVLVFGQQQHIFDFAINPHLPQLFLQRPRIRVTGPSNINNKKRIQTTFLDP